MSKPTELVKQEKVLKFELEEAKLATLQQALDLAVKATGLQAAKQIGELWGFIADQVRPQLEKKE